MIIITGMDNSGKTTLCQDLSRRTGLPVLHSAGPQLTPDEKKLWTLDQLTREMVIPNHVIYDRFMPLEEMVYGPILRGHSDFRLGDPFMELLAELDPVIIYTRPDCDTILEDNGRDQMDGVREKGKALLAGWDELMMNLSTLGWDIRPYNWKNGPMTEEQIDHIFKEG